MFVTRDSLTSASIIIFAEADDFRAHKYSDSDIVYQKPPRSKRTA